MALSVSGTLGETIFDDVLPVMFTPAVQDQLRLKVADQLAHFPALDDDRIMVLVGALVVELTLDDLLRTMIPGFNELVKAKEFTFSMKTNLARTLRVCPSRIFGATDSIRNIRNAVAHNLEITTIAAVKPEYIASLKGHATAFEPAVDNGEDLRKTFFDVAMYVSFAFYAYALHTCKLFTLIRSAPFKEQFIEHCQANP